MEKGMKLLPTEVSFFIQDWSESWIKEIWIRVQELKNPDNNLIRIIDHPEFKSKFYNQSDGLFVPFEDNKMTVEEIEVWLRSIGMVDWEED
jgi:hypothetical protein